MATVKFELSLSEGIRWVPVNGKVAIDAGKYAGTLAGVALSRNAGE